MVLDELAVPLVQAPMAGGPSTPALAAAVCEAGALGFLAAGYRDAAAVRADIAALRARTSRPFGVGVFVPGPAGGAAEDVAAYARRLAPEAARLGVEPGAARATDDDWEATLALLRAEPVPVVAFAFGCPPAGTVAALQAAGTEAWVTVTSAEEAHAAAAAGADVLVCQGLEAGGHQGAWADDDATERFGLLALLQLVAAATDVPFVAAGAITTGAALAAVLCAGARAGFAGTAFLRCPEAGTAHGHAARLATATPTALTRAFTGRTARGLVNRFMVEHGAAAPAAYPELHHVTAPLRAAGRARGDVEVVNLWAGQAHALAEALPAAEVVARLAAEARDALRRVPAW